jgi:hypothetical protein
MKRGILVVAVAILAAMCLANTPANANPMDDTQTVVQQNMIVEMVQPDRTPNAVPSADTPLFAINIEIRPISIGVEMTQGASVVDNTAPPDLAMTVVNSPAMKEELAKDAATEVDLTIWMATGVLTQKLTVASATIQKAAYPPDRQFKNASLFTRNTAKEAGHFLNYRIRV